MPLNNIVDKKENILENDMMEKKIKRNGRELKRILHGRKKKAKLENRKIK